MEASRSEVIDSASDRARLRLLSDAGLALVSSLDYAKPLQRIAELSLGLLADYCIFDVLSADGKMLRVAWAHRNPEWPHLEHIGKFAPPIASDNHPTARVIRTGEPVFVPDFDNGWMQQITWSPEHLQEMRRLNPHSVMFVPLTAHGMTVGAAIFAFSESARRHTESDLELAVDLGRRAGLAVLHARQYEALESSATRLREMTDRQRVLINELDHRVKNTLAIVQAMAAQTFRAGADPQQARNDFSDRLAAFARAHDLLTRDHWERTDLSELAHEIVRAHQAPGNPRFTIVGEPVRVPPRLAVTLAMVLHELATNAVKYGALSTDEGQVELRWQGLAGDPPILELSWKESGGPPVSQPTRRGFGSRLIERQISSEKDGHADIRYEPSGLVCLFRLPMP